MEPPAARRGFDFGRLSTGSKALLASALALFITLFFPWQSIPGCEVTAEIVPTLQCTVTGFAGLGILVAILTIGVVVWEAILGAGVAPNTGAVSPALIGTALGAAAALFAVIKFLTSLGGGPLNLLDIAWGAFIGLVAALALAYASYLRFRESRAAPRAGRGPTML